MRCCGFNKTAAFQIELANYLSCFNKKQCGTVELSLSNTTHDQTID